VKVCSGICVAEKLADYCDAVLMIDILCKPGDKCCVSRDAFGDFPPPELLVIDRLNSSRYDEKNGGGVLSKVSSPLTTTRPNTSLPTSVSAIASAITMMTTTMMAATRQPSIRTTTTRPKPEPFKPCKGKCTSGLPVLFCENIDGDADCPPNDFTVICCISEPQKVVIYIVL